MATVRLSPPIVSDPPAAMTSDSCEPSGSAPERLKKIVPAAEPPVPVLVFAAMMASGRVDWPTAPAGSATLVTRISAARALPGVAGRSATATATQQTSTTRIRPTIPSE
jgi:hypothetical protein